MDELIYEIWLDDELRTIYARGVDKHEAWGKVQHRGTLLDSMTQAEFDEKFSPPEVL